MTGTALGAVLGTLKEIGIEKDFMEDLADRMRSGSGDLFPVISQYALTRSQRLIVKIWPLRPLQTLRARVLH